MASAAREMVVVLDVGGEGTEVVWTVVLFGVVEGTVAACDAPGAAATRGDASRPPARPYATVPSAGQPPEVATVVRPTRPAAPSRARFSGGEMGSALMMTLEWFCCCWWCCCEPWWE